ncbi:MAG TPA: hypothetical protein VFZ42_08960 [Chitinophagaceae bacterium]
MPVLKPRAKCIRKFLYYFPGGFTGEKYTSWERDYKWAAHVKWKENLYKKEYLRLLSAKDYAEIARRAIWMESGTNLLFSFEKMAIRDAVKTGDGAQLFAEGLFEYVYGKKKLQDRFEAFTDVLASLPRKQTRVVTWPVQTVFGFIANPAEFIFLKPRVTQLAAKKYDYPFKYSSRPNWDTYQSMLDFAAVIQQDVTMLKPQDMIDIQSFIWVLGSEEYPD